MAGYRRGGRRGRPASTDGGEAAAERKPKPFTPERAWNYLLWLLARRSYTVSELRQRLERRGLPEADAEPLLARLVELRLVDDALYAEQYVNSRQAARGRSALRRELQRKGVAEELVEKELEELTPDQQADAATELLERNAWRYRPGGRAGADGRDAEGRDDGDEMDGDVVTEEDAYARRERLYRARSKAFAFLARRGFGADAAATALERVGWFDADD